MKILRDAELKSTSPRHCNTCPPKRYGNDVATGSDQGMRVRGQSRFFREVLGGDGLELDGDTVEHLRDSMEHGGDPVEHDGDILQHGGDTLEPVCHELQRGLAVRLSRTCRRLC